MNIEIETKKQPIVRFGNNEVNLNLFNYDKIVDDTVFTWHYMYCFANDIKHTYMKNNKKR